MEIERELRRDEKIGYKRAKIRIELGVAAKGGIDREVRRRALFQQIRNNHVLSKHII